MNSFLTVVAMGLFLTWLYRTTVQTNRARAFNRTHTPRIRIVGNERTMSMKELRELKHNEMRPVDKNFLLREENFKEGEQYVAQEMNA